MAMESLPQLSIREQLIPSELHQGIGWKEERSLNVIAVRSMANKKKIRFQSFRNFVSPIGINKMGKRQGKKIVKNFADLPKMQKISERKEYQNRFAQ